VLRAGKASLEFQSRPELLYKPAELVRTRERAQDNKDLVPVL
jgi:hypothetical protein